MPVRCSSCGVTSELELAFRKAGPRRYCPRCWERRDVRSGREALVQFGLIALIGAAMLVIFPQQSPGWIMLNVVLFGLVSVACVTAHELGHAVVGWLMRLRVHTLVVGVGPPLLRARVAGVDLRFHLIPFEGYVLATHPDRRLVRLRHFLMTLGGPLANLGLLLGLLFFYTPRELLSEEIPKVTTQLAPVAALIAANGLDLVSALFPRSGRWASGEQYQTDGLGLLRIPFWPPEAADVLHAHHFYRSGCDALRSADLAAAVGWFEAGLKHYAENGELRHGLATARVFQGRAAEARDQFVRFLAETDPTATDLDAVGWRMLLLNDIAWCDLMLGGAELLHEAERYSAEAFGAMPWRPEFRGTRGCVLVELGRADEGLPLVRDALRDNDSDLVKALDACYLALGEHRRGDAKAARRYLAEARRLHPECPLLDRVAGEVGQSPV